MSMKLGQYLLWSCMLHTLSPETFGFDISLFILGMGGGLVRSIIHDQIKLRQGLINVFVGGIVANYFTKLIMNVLHFKDKEHIFAAALILGFFAVGLFVMLEKAESWAKNNPKTFFAWVVNGLSSLLKGDNKDSENDKK